MSSFDIESRASREKRRKRSHGGGSGAGAGGAGGGSSDCGGFGWESGRRYGGGGGGGVSFGSYRNEDKMSLKSVKSREFNLHHPEHR